MCHCIMRSCHGCTCTCHGKQNPVRLHPAPSIVRTETKPARQVVTKTVGGTYQTGWTLGEVRALLKETEHLPGDTLVTAKNAIPDSMPHPDPSRRTPQMSVSWDEPVR